MIFNTSYKNDKYTQESVKVLGKSFSLLKIIKTGGIGSSRLIIKELSSRLTPKNAQYTSINYANIELRPKGIIVHFANKLERYSWLIPYFSLVVYNSQTFSIHSNGNFIKFYKNKNYKNNKKFIKKMIALKSSTLNLSYYDV